MSEEVEEVKDEAIPAGSEVAGGAIEGEGNPSEVPAPAEAPEAVEASEVPLMYADLEVEVSVDDEVRSALTEKGLDADAIVKELYASKDFSLTRETKDKLDAAFGAYFVDYYLRTVKESNDRMVSDHKAGIEAQEASVREAEEWGVQQVGGDWEAFEQKVLPKMSEAQIEQFNAAMASGNKLVQEYALKAALAMTGEEAAASAVVEPEVPEIELGGESASNDSGAITAQEYRSLMIQVRKDTTGNRAAYAAEMAKLDQRRAAGIARGI